MYEDGDTTTPSVPFGGRLTFGLTLLTCFVCMEFNIWWEPELTDGIRLLRLMTEMK